MIYYLLEIAVIVFLFMQVVIPVARGLPVFPIFREKKYEDKIKDLKQQRSVVELQKEIKELEDYLENLMKEEK